jgi:hypothetical protein
MVGLLGRIINPAAPRQTPLPFPGSIQADKTNPFALDQLAHGRVFVQHRHKPPVRNSWEYIFSQAFLYFSSAFGKVSLFGISSTSRKGTERRSS